MNNQNQIFATGVHLQAMQVNLNGINQWRWIAVGFEEDTYLDGKTIDVYDFANSFEGLINKQESPIS